METVETESFTTPAEQMQNANKTESAEKFQKFLYELFDKNGVLGDLRAYLRGHIVNVLKNAQTGDPPTCQKHFTQRLDPKFQALNMLVTEYLLCMEFSYSLSVFISEIPLANMLFGFAKSLMELGADDKVLRLRFKEHDVWSILNYLGVKCDSEHANNIIEMYKTQKDSPLLLCILRCIQLHNAEVNYPGANSQDGSASSASKSSDSELSHHQRQEKCKHFAFCRICHARYIRLREKYRRKKSHFCKNEKRSSVNPLNVQNILKKIECMERNLIDEMFEQQKTMYETEADMLKSETEEQMKRSLASHAMHFQQRESELEETFKAREAALEGNIEHKKRFLWGLAKALRTQHAQMTSAMRAVTEETKRLAEREQSLKAQLTEAEQMLKQRGEDMRKQITDELVMLEEHLESMKSERDSLNRERIELDTRKSQSDTNIVHVKVENNDLKTHYEVLKEELSLVKKYLEGNREAKCVEKGTITEISNVNSRINVVMNNEMGIGVREEVKPAQVFNDLKKQKNVNFRQVCKSQTNMAESPGPRSRSGSRSRSPSPNTSAALRSLVADNESLRRTATQQSAQIAELASRAARMHAALRPRTAPAALPPSGLARQNPTAFGWCKGAGEELSLLSQQPTVLVPGAPRPFVGVGGERRSDSRRHLINQWRAMRRRMSPLASGSKPRTERYRSHSKEREEEGEERATNDDEADQEDSWTIRTRTQRTGLCQTGSCGGQEPLPSSGTVRSQCHEDAVSISSPPSTHRETETRPREEIIVFQAMRDTLRSKESTERNKTREKSPKSVLREAKEKLRTVTRPSTTRDKSPCAALREAKLRLRKLEIEAEAVERSYMDFRRRRERRRPDNTSDGTNLLQTADKNPFQTENRPENSQRQPTTRNSMKTDLEKFLTRYQNDLDIGQTHFKNKNTAAEIIKPIPEVFSDVNRDMHGPKHDYLAKPLTEFRKFYYSQCDRQIDDVENIPESNYEDGSPDNQNSEEFKNRLSEIEKATHKKEKELEMLEQNLSKIYNLHDVPTKETDVPLKKTKGVDMRDDNVLRVEIEPTENENDVILVESSVDSRAMSKADSCDENLSTKMTIIVSPKLIEPRSELEKSRRSPSPEQQAHLTRKDVFNAIFNAAKDSSSNEIRLEPGDQDSVIEQDEYADDFSADVDNQAEIDRDIDSPVSLPKNSEDDFWE